MNFVAFGSLASAATSANPLSDGWGDLDRLPVNVTVYRDSKIQTFKVPRSDLSNYCTHCVNHDHRTFDFLSTENREIAENCAANAQDGRHVHVAYESSELCKKASSQEARDQFLTGYAKYDIVKKDGVINMNMKVRLMMGQNVAAPRAHEILEKSKECVPLIQSVWARYGIRFNLRLDSDREPVFKDADHYPKLIDGAGRSNTNTFYYHHVIWQPETTRQDLYCKMLVHEFGHFTGFDDEYEDAMCTDRPDVFVFEKHPAFWPHDIMSEALDYPWERIDFYPHQIKKVLEPLCR